MTPEKKDNTLTRWLLAATIALLVLVLCLQLWQMFGKRTSGESGSPNSAAAPASPQATEPLNPLSGNISHGKAAMIEDVQTLNPALSFDDLAALSAEELEQLYAAGAPGLPIGVSAAAQAAETYAGTLAVNSVTNETDPELDESPAHYEVELHHPTLGDFTYKVDAYSGQVLEGTSNIMQNGYIPAPGQEVPAAQVPDAQVPDTQTSAAQAQFAGEEAAKNAAFAHAGVSAADAANLRCKLDWDDGRQVYDIAFWVGGTEYDYEIDASTSAVIEAKQERDSRQDGASAQQNSGFIGEEAAKSAALAHAGVSAADAGYVEWELDEDGGRWVYELEFRAGGVEYDYEIDASTGTVVKAKQER